MTTYKTLAFVLHRRPWKHFHQVLWLFTETHGLLPVLGYGLARFGSRRSGNLDAGNLCEVDLEKRRNYFSLRHAQAIDTCQKIKNDFKSAAMLIMLLHLLAKTLPVEMAMPKVFDFFGETVRSLRSLGEKTGRKTAAKEHHDFYRCFEKNLMTHLGYQTSLMANVRPEHIRDHLERGEQMLELIV